MVIGDADKMMRWSRRNQILLFLVVIVTCIVYYISLNGNIERNLDLTRSSLITENATQNSFENGTQYKPLSASGNSSSSTASIDKRASINEYIEAKLQEALREDKGTGCQIPHLDPFAKDVMQFDKVHPEVSCEGLDWVKCYLHECKVVKRVLATTTDIRCSYQDIIYLSDAKYTIGVSQVVVGAETYTLRASDHVKVVCTGKVDGSKQKYMGYAIGYRQSTTKPRPPAGAINILIFGFDSTSKNGFIRKMPQSYRYITKVLNATVLNGYNIVGDGTPAALFPILTGKTELELPDMRRVTNRGTLDSFPFLFYRMKALGYHTAYFEDMPGIGTFQYRFNGFQRQPADHYLRSFFIDSGYKRHWHPTKPGPYCVGDTPRYELMMNITQQFMQLPGSKFGFTFIADITHDDFNMISTADGATVKFLEELKSDGVMDNTLLMIMGDHGPRFANVRSTLQGKLEERLPLMAIHLPAALTDRRPDIIDSLSLNADALTTPHDIHATILDALDLEGLMNPYKIKGADLYRGLSLFQPIPRNRSCSEAGIEPHWCACLKWQNVSRYDTLYQKTVDAFVDFINSLTEPVRDKCEPRTLTSISWVMVQRANSNLLKFKEARDQDGYIGKFTGMTKRTRDNYQIKVTVGPGEGVYEASATYLIQEQRFLFDTRDISRISAYNDEPRCISKTHPHLNMYCYCKNHMQIPLTRYEENTVA